MAVQLGRLPGRGPAHSVDIKGLVLIIKNMILIVSGDYYTNGNDAL